MAAMGKSYASGEPPLACGLISTSHNNPNSPLLPSPSFALRATSTHRSPPLPTVTFGVTGPSHDVPAAGTSCRVSFCALLVCGAVSARGTMSVIANRVATTPSICRYGLVILGCIIAPAWTCFFLGSRVIQGRKAYHVDLPYMQ